MLRSSLAIIAAAFVITVSSFDHVKTNVSRASEGIELLAPVGKTPKWDRMFAWKEVPGEKAYIIEITYPERLPCAGSSLTLQAGTTDIPLQVVAPANPPLEGISCVSGTCRIKAPGVFIARKPAGNVKGGACGKGDIYSYQWALRTAAGLHSERISFAFE